MDILSHLNSGIAVVEYAAKKGLTFSPAQKKSFLVGCARPDLSADKDAAHFYFKHRESGWRAPDVQRFRATVEAAGGWTPELLGVYAHLATDVLFFRDYVARKLPDGSILAEDGTRWENGRAYKRAFLYRTYEANRAMPHKELDQLVQLVRTAEPEEMELSELTLASGWKDQLLSFVSPTDGCSLDPATREAVNQLRSFAQRAANELVADEWFMTALRQTLGGS